MLLTNSILYDLLIFLATSILVLYLYLIRHANYWKDRGIPYKKSVLFVGSMLDVFTSKKAIGDLFKEFYTEMKTPYLGIYIMDKPALLTSDLSLAQHVFIKDFNNFVNRPFANRNNTIGREMVAFMKDDAWKQHRKKISNGYTKVKNYFALSQITGKNLIDYLKKISVKTDLINVKHAAELYGCEIMTTIGLGAKADLFVNENSVFKKVQQKIFNLENKIRAIAISSYILFPSLSHIFRINFVEPECEQILYNVFKTSFKNREETKTIGNDFLDALTKIKNEKDPNYDSTIENLGTHAITFWISGYETTSILITSILYNLAKNVCVQTKLREEINRLLDNTPDGELTYDILKKKAKYLEMVIKESLRMYPPLPFISRTPKEDYKIPGTDIVLEKGTSIFFPIYAIHNDPANFKDPEQFIPERFLNEDEFIPFSYMPFGVGPRMCLGEKFGLLNAMLVIALVVKNFEWELRDESQKIMEFYTKASVLSPTTDKSIFRFKKILQ